MFLSLESNYGIVFQHNCTDAGLCSYLEMPLKHLSSLFKSTNANSASEVYIGLGFLHCFEY